MSPMFAVMMAGETLWALGSALELVCVDLGLKRLCLDVRILGTLAALLGLSAFVLRYTGRSDWLRGRRAGWVVAGAVAMVAMVWTDPWHHFYFAGLRAEVVDGQVIAIRSFGPGFWVIFGYCYGLVAASTAFLIHAAVHSSGVYRAQALLMLIGVLFPWLVDVIDMSRVLGFIPGDFVSMSFAVTGLCFLPALWKFHLLELPPIAWAVVVKGMDDPVVVLDPSRRIVELNLAAERLTGLREFEAAGAEASSAFAHWPELADRLDRIQGSEESFVLDGPGPSPSPSVYDARISPLSQGGRPCGWVLALRDVTQLKRAEEDRARMLGEKAADRAKDRLIATLSHELRTPLTPILATVSAMREDPTTPEALLGVLEMIHRNVALEARLIDDLVDQTRVRRGQLRLEREVVDVHELIGHVVEIFRENAREAGLRLDLDLAAEKRRLFADPARMQQVLWNLVKNAIQFTPPGGRVAIETRNAEARPGEGERDALVVRVRDTGAGIAPGELPRLFEGFERPLAPTSSGAGLGLGLAISRAVAELHGGRLFAESEGEGRGATFTIEMPDALAPEPKPIGAPVQAEHESSGRPLTILLVEDNVDTLEFLSRLLREKGHDVLPAGRLDSALRLAAGREFDVLVSDIELPDGNGHELMWRLQAVRATPGIALSGFGTADDVEMSLSAGFAEHLTKPVDFRRLMDAVDRVTARAEDHLVEN